MYHHFFKTDWKPTIFSSSFHRGPDLGQDPRAQPKYGGHEGEFEKNEQRVYAKDMVIFLGDPKMEILSGWWFGTFFIFPYIGNSHPNWLIFFRGVQTTNQLWELIGIYWDHRVDSFGSFLGDHRIVFLGFFSSFSGTWLLFIEIFFGCVDIEAIPNSWMQNQWYCWCPFDFELICCLLFALYVHHSCGYVSWFSACISNTLNKLHVLHPTHILYIDMLFARR